MENFGVSKKIKLQQLNACVCTLKQEDLKTV